MAITKLMNMKASKTGKIDAHLKNAIAYILNPKKLGDANLAGGINCLPELAYEQMKSTKELFGKQCISFKQVLLCNGIQHVQDFCCEISNYNDQGKT